jgi:hypothetical protein
VQVRIMYLPALSGQSTMGKTCKAAEMAYLINNPGLSSHAQRSLGVLPINGGIATVAVSRHATNP